MHSQRAVAAVPPPIPDGSQSLPSSSAHIDALLSSAAGYSSRPSYSTAGIDVSSIDSIDASLALTQSRLGSWGKPGAAVAGASPFRAGNATQSTAAGPSYTQPTSNIGHINPSSTPAVSAASGKRGFAQSSLVLSSQDAEPDTVAQQLHEALSDRNAAEREIYMLTTQLRANDAMTVEWEADVRRLREELSSARRMLAEIDTHKAGPSGSLGSDLQSLILEFKAQLVRVQETVSGCATQNDLQSIILRATAQARERQAASAQAQHLAMQAEVQQQVTAQAARSKAELVALERSMVAQLSQVTEAHDAALQQAREHNGRLEEALAAARGAKARLEGEVATLRGTVDKLAAAGEGAARRLAAAEEATRHAGRSANALATAGMQRLDSHVSLMQSTHQELSAALEDVRYKAQRLATQAAQLEEREKRLQDASADHREALSAAAETQAHVDDRLAEAHREAAAAAAAASAAAAHERALQQREAKLQEAEVAAAKARSELAQAQSVHVALQAQLERDAQALQAQQEAAAAAGAEAAGAAAAADQKHNNAAQLQAEAAAAMRSVQQREEALQAREAALREAEQAAAAAKAEHAEAEQALRDAQTEVSAQQVRVQAAQTAAADAQASADSQLAQAKAAATAAAETEAANARATTELRAEQAELQAERMQLEQLLTAARAAEQAAAAREAQAADATSRDGALAAQVGQLKEQLAALRMEQQEQQEAAQADASKLQAAALAAESKAAALEAQLKQQRESATSTATADEERQRATSAAIAEATRRAATSELALQQTVAQNEELRAALGTARTEREVHVAALLALRQHLGAVLGCVGDAMLTREGGGAAPATPAGGAGGVPTPLATADARRVRQVLHLVGGSSTPSAHGSTPAGMLSPPPPFAVGGGVASPPSPPLSSATASPPAVPQLQLPVERRRRDSHSDEYSTDDGFEGDDQSDAEEGTSASEGGGAAAPPEAQAPPLRSPSVKPFAGEGFVMSSGVIGLVAHCGRLGVTIDTAQGEAAELGATALRGVAPECAAYEYLQAGDALWRAVWPAVVPDEGSFQQLAAEHGGFVPEGALKLQQGALGAVDADLQTDTVEPVQQRLRSLMARASARRPLVLLFRRLDMDTSDGEDG